MTVTVVVALLVALTLALLVTLFLTEKAFLSYVIHLIIAWSYLCFVCLSYRLSTLSTCIRISLVCKPLLHSFSSDSACLHTLHPCPPLSSSSCLLSTVSASFCTLCLCLSLTRLSSLNSAAFWSPLSISHYKPFLSSFYCHDFTSYFKYVISLSSLF